MSLDPMVSPAVALALALALAGGCLWGELRAASARGWRVAGCLLAIAAWLGLALQPALVGGGEARRAVVLTSGWEEAPRRSWGGDGVAHRVGTPEVPDLGWVLRRHPRLEELIVVGQGLEAWQFSGYRGLVIRVPSTPLASDSSVRWSAIDWSRRIELGSALVVRGQVRMKGASGRDPTVGIELVDPAGEVRAVPADAEGFFRVAMRPAVPGRHLYTLRAGVSGAPSLEEIVDVVVEPPRPPDVVWLEASPGFESRHVEAWLGDLGGGLALRSEMAPGIARVVERGLAAPAAGRLAAASLADLDLLVVDVRTLGVLSPRERRAIEAAVRDGLGVLVRVEEEVEHLPGNTPWLAGIEIETEPAGGGEAPSPAEAELWQVHLTLPDTAEDSPPPLDLPRRDLTVAGAAECRLEDRAGRCLAAGRRLGRGSVTVTLVERTYRWRLAGDEAAHRIYWSLLLGQTARPRRAVPSIEVPAGPLSVDHPLEVVLWSAAAEPTLGSNGAMDAEDAEAEPLQVALRQNPGLPQRWTGTVWPRREGWQCLSGGDEGTPPACFYARGTLAWPGLAEARQGAATARRAVLGDPRPAVDGGAHAVWRPLPRWIFFALLLAAVAAVWSSGTTRRPNR